MKHLLPILLLLSAHVSAQQYEMPAKVADSQVFYAAQSRWQQIELGEASLKKKDYDSALYHFNIAYAYEPGTYLCGNDAEGQEQAKAIHYAECYAGLGNNDTAITLLIKYAFGGLNGEPMQIIEALKKPLSATYGKEHVLQEFRKAAHTIRISQQSKYNFIVTLFGRDIYLSPASKTWAYRGIYHKAPEDPAIPQVRAITDEQVLEQAHKRYLTSAIYKTFTTL
jgi:hypothetical protein